MYESTVERRLVRAVERSGGLALKFISPGRAGVPDRLVCLPGARVVFVELKAPGGRPRPLQLKRTEELRALGFEVRVIDGPQAVDDFVREVLGP